MSLKNDPDMLKMKECAYCKEVFRELDNLGQMQCRRHPLPTFVDRLNMNRIVYACCEQTKESSGCWTYDHAERLMPMEDLSIPRVEAVSIIDHLNGPGVRYDKTKDSLVIRRSMRVY